MSERNIVLVDMDGVLADFDGATAAHLTKRQGKPENNLNAERMKCDG